MKHTPPNSQKIYTSPRQNGGFTLLEVLVALVVFTVGILAVLGMQLTSIRGNHTAYQFFEGTNQGADILEAMSGQPYTHGNFTTGTNAIVTRLGVISS